MLGHSPKQYTLKRPVTNGTATAPAFPPRSRYTGGVRLWAAAALAAYFLFFFRLTGTGLVGPDEPRYAWIGREMARSGDWVTPRLWGQPWFEKPALLYWTTAAAFKAGLGDDWAPRLPVATLSVLFLLFFFWRLRAELGNPAAGYATGVLATSAGWVAYSRVAVFDLPLSAVFGAAMLALLAWLERRQTRWLMSFTALLGLSVLAKGLVGPVLAALTLLCWSARNGLRELRSLLRPAALLVFLAVASPWYMLCYLRNGPPFLAEFFWRQHFARYAAGALAHNQPLWYFVPVLALGLLPWTPLLTAFGAKTLWRERKLFFFLARQAACLYSSRPACNRGVGGRGAGAHQAHADRSAPLRRRAGIVSGRRRDFAGSA